MAARVAGGAGGPGLLAGKGPGHLDGLEAGTQPVMACRHASIGLWPFGGRPKVEALMPRHNPRAFASYLLLQTPDILLAGLILFVLHGWGVLSLAWTLALFAGWVANDLALYPLLKDVFGPPRTEPQSLIGARAVAQERLAPSGMVKLGGELWWAEALGADAAIAAGTVVTIRGRRGLTLVVEAEGPAGADEARAPGAGRERRTMG